MKGAHTHEQKSQKSAEQEAAGIRLQPSAETRTGKDAAAHRHKIIQAARTAHSDYRYVPCNSDRLLPCAAAENNLIPHGICGR